jgi:sulfur carrier protein ThiS
MNPLTTIVNEIFDAADAAAAKTAVASLTLTTQTDVDNFAVELNQQFVQTAGMIPRLTTNNDALDKQVIQLTAEMKSLADVVNKLDGDKSVLTALKDAIIKAFADHTLDREKLVEVIAGMVGIASVPVATVVPKDVHYPSSKTVEEQIEWIRNEFGVNKYLAAGLQRDRTELKNLIAKMGKNLVC